MKYKYFLLILGLISCLPNIANSADDVIVQEGTGKSYIKTASGDLWPLGMAYTTDGNGHILTLGGSTLVADDLIVPSDGKAYLKDSLNRLFPASIFYTTDGNGHVIPATLSFTAPLVNTSGVVACNAASGSQPGCLSSSDWTAFNAKQATAYTPLVSTNWLSYPNSVVGALDSLAASKHLNTYHVDKNGHDSATCGAMLNPCLTISQALTNVGVSATAADVKNAKTVIIGAGAYDEDLTIPSGRIITLLAEGVVILGNGSGSNWASTDSKTITWNPLAADLHGSDIKPALNIGTVLPSDATSTFIAESQNFHISGNLVINGDGTTKSLSLHGVKIWGTLSHTDASLVNWQAYRTLIVGAVSDTGNLVLERAYDSRFNALVQVNAINMAFNSSFNAGITVASVQQNLLPNGFYHCHIAGAFTGAASSARFDDVTRQDFRSSGATLAGSATLAYVSDSFLSQSASGSQPSCSSVNRGLQWLVQGGAGVADIIQICQKDAADAYGWVTH